MPGNKVIGKDVVLIGQEWIADYLGVTSQAISMWFKRALTAPPASDLHNLPVPVLVQYGPGKTPNKVWNITSLPSWKKWHETHLDLHGKHIPLKQRPVIIITYEED